jgi:hypothetical protein
MKFPPKSDRDAAADLLWLYLLMTNAGPRLRSSIAWLSEMPNAARRRRRRVSKIPTDAEALRLTLEIALKAIAAIERQILIDRFAFGLTWRQVAERSGIDDGPARRIGRAAIANFCADLRRRGLLGD